MLSIAEATAADDGALVDLWTRCDLVRPWNDACADIARARKSGCAVILAGREDGAIVAAVMVGDDGHRGWFYYLAVDPQKQGNGYGRAMTAAGEQWLKARGCEKVMLMVRPDNVKVHDFYRAAGYFEQPRALFAKWLDGRDPTP
ncbi:MAG TPA: GNAT family acetyltransferase [Pseudolabrys sp.]|nr:GNAT family acetyltransferase [Pseudolabrys sp.]